MTENPTQTDQGTEKCGARRKSGEPCRRSKGYGTSHLGYGNCKFHSGSTPNGIKAAIREQAVEARGMFDLPVNIPPEVALLQEVHRAAGAIEWLKARINELKPEELVWGVSEEKDSTGHLGDSQTRSAMYNQWYRMIGDERKRVVEASKACIAAGIMEREVRVAEQQGLMLATALRAILDQLNLTPEQKQLALVVVPQQLRMLTQ